MGVTMHGGTQTGAVTPTCNDCGISLCWDIARIEYLEAKAFWDAWRCQECEGSRPSAYAWKCINGREALPTAVEELVVAFDDANPSLEDGSDSRDSRTVSSCFTAVLAAAGIASSVIGIADVRGRTHYGIAVGDLTIDWCARRHDPDAPVPLVFRSTLTWPVEPPTNEQLLERIAELDPEQLDALIARALARRRAA